MAECNCGTGSLPIIKQGDAYAVQVSLTFNGEPIVYSDLDLIEEIEFTFGELAPMRFKPKSIYNTTIGAFLVPLTQKQTFMLEDGKILVDCRVQFWGGDVIGVSRMARVFVREALSGEILSAKPYHGITPSAPSDIVVIPLTVTTNGTYSAPSGRAYSPVVVNVPQGSGDVVRASWHQCPEAVREYLADVTYDPSDYSTSQIAEYAPSTADRANTRPIGYTSGGVTYYNEVPNVQTPFANSQTAGTLMPLDYLRWINCPHTWNVRDIGGWTCDGGTVKYGLIIRGAQPFSDDRSVLVGECGVRHDINLRGSTEDTATSSPLGSDVYFHIWSEKAQYHITNKPLVKDIMRTIFNAVVHNEPCYIHCYYGCDRTGTILLLLEAVLGMSQSDIDKDYELSSFYYGTGTDENARRRNESEWTGLIAEVNAYTGTTIRDKVVNYLASTGISVAEINAFRRAAINGNPSDVVANVETYSVTKTLSHVTSNGENTATEYQPYTATLTPEDGYVIDGDTVRVTMGGTDITSSIFSGDATQRRVTVTHNLTNCTANGAATAVVGQSYVSDITADSGYSIDASSVVVMMGGQNVSTYYSNGRISIPSVTGAVTITATAVASEPENLFNPEQAQANKRVNSSGEIVDNAGSGSVLPTILSNPIPLSFNNEYLYVKCDKEQTSSLAGIVSMFDSSDNYITQYNVKSTNTNSGFASDAKSFWFKPVSAAYSDVANVRVQLNWTDANEIEVYKTSSEPSLT